MEEKEDGETMIVEVYDDGTAILKATTKKQKKEQLKVLGEGAKLLYTIKGKDWTDCMQQYHKNNGWEDYKPF